MKPTYSNLIDLQDTYSQYEYDHKRPTTEQVNTAAYLLTTSQDTQEQLTARTYGEHVGAWYWSNAHKEWITPPRKEWTIVRPT